MTFRKLKEFLSTPPILTKPKSGLPIIKYLSVFEHVVSSVLVQEFGVE